MTAKNDKRQKRLEVFKPGASRTQVLRAGSRAATANKTSTLNSKKGQHDKALRLATELAIELHREALQELEKH